MQPWLLYVTINTCTQSLAGDKPKFPYLNSQWYSAHLNWLVCHELVTQLLQWLPQHWRHSLLHSLPEGTEKQVSTCRTSILPRTPHHTHTRFIPTELQLDYLQGATVIRLDSLPGFLCWWLLPLSSSLWSPGRTGMDLQQTHAAWSSSSRGVHGRWIIPPDTPCHSAFRYCMHIRYLHAHRTIQAYIIAPIAHGLYIAIGTPLTISPMWFSPKVNPYMWALALCWSMYSLLESQMMCFSISSFSDR